MVADVIGAILSNASILLVAIAIIVTIAKLRRAAFGRRVVTAQYVLWGETLFYAVGIGSIYFGLMHAYAQRVAAPSIGWTPSPFEFELGWMEIGLGVVALTSLWRGYETRIAVTLIFAIFSFAAAIQHIYQMAHAHNYAPGNAGAILWFGDIAVPIFLLLLAFLSRDAYERTERVF